MPQRFDNEVNNDVKQAINDASDWSQGVSKAFDKLRDDVYFAKQTYGEDSKEYKSFSSGVAKGMSPSVIDEISLAWAQKNIKKYDTSGDNRLNYGEISQGIRTTADPLEREMLSSLRDHYDEIKKAGGSFPFGHRDSIAQNDLKKSLENHQEQRDEAARLAIEAERRVQAEARSRDFMTPLVEAPEGIASRSLFKVIDDLPGGRRDNNINQKDLKRYLEEYDRREMQGDLGGNYTPDKRSYVQTLKDEWNSPDVVRMRGTHTDYSRDSRGETVANSAISLDSLQKAGGLGRQDVFAAFSYQQERFVAAPEQPQIEQAEAKAPVEAEKQTRAAAKEISVEPEAKPSKPVVQGGGGGGEALGPEKKDAMPAAPAPERAFDINRDSAISMFQLPGAHSEVAAAVTRKATGARAEMTPPPGEPVDAIPAPPAREVVRAEKAEKPQPALEKEKAAQVVAEVQAVPRPSIADQAIESTVWDVSDLSQGGSAASRRLSDHLYHSKNFFGETPTYNYYAKGVAQGMEPQVMDDVAVGWAKRNIQRFDVSNDNRLNRGEIDLAIRTSNDPLERAMLKSVQSQFEDIKRDGTSFPFHRDSLSANDMQKHLDATLKTRQDIEAARIAQEQLEIRQEASRELMRPLLQTRDGNPNRSLLKVIDDLPGGHRDNKLSKSDLKRYLDEYDRREMQGDLGGNYNPYNRQYVQDLRNNWDSQDVIRLRGTYQAHDRNQSDRRIPNSTISLESLNEAAGWYKNSSPFANIENS